MDIILALLLFHVRLGAQGFVYLYQNEATAVPQKVKKELERWL